jgi:hypothetical protein
VVLSQHSGQLEFTDVFELDQLVPDARTLLPSLFLGISELFVGNEALLGEQVPYPVFHGFGRHS